MQLDQSVSTVYRPAPLIFMVSWTSLLATGWVVLWAGLLFLEANAQDLGIDELKPGLSRVAALLWTLAATGWVALIWPPERSIGAIFIGLHVVAALVFSIFVVALALQANDPMAPNFDTIYLLAGGPLAIGAVKTVVAVWRDYRESNSGC